MMGEKKSAASRWFHGQPNFVSIGGEKMNPRYFFFLGGGDLNMSMTQLHHFWVDAAQLGVRDVQVRPIGQLS